MNEIAVSVWPDDNGSLPHAVLLAIELADALEGDTDLGPWLTEAAYEFTSNIVKHDSLLNDALRDQFRPGLDLEGDVADEPEKDFDHEPSCGFGELSDVFEDQGAWRGFGLSVEEPRSGITWRERERMKAEIEAWCERANEIVDRVKPPVDPVDNVVSMWEARQW